MIRRLGWRDGLSFAEVSRRTSHTYAIVRNILTGTTYTQHTTDTHDWPLESVRRAIVVLYTSVRR